MITKINTPADCIQALNENLDGLLTGKRKVNIVKEVNNTVGKLLDVHRLEAVSKTLANDRSGLNWFTLNADKGLPSSEKSSKGEFFESGYNQAKTIAETGSLKLGAKV